MKQFFWYRNSTGHIRISWIHTTAEGKVLLGRIVTIFAGPSWSSVSQPFEIEIAPEEVHSDENLYCKINMPLEDFISDHKDLMMSAEYEFFLREMV